MSIFNKISFSRRTNTLTRALFMRYLMVVAVLLILVGIIQLQSIRSALSLAGESSLTFALRDALPEPEILAHMNDKDFSKLVPSLLESLSVRGMNVRMYDAHLHAIGERHSRYDPVHLINFTPQFAAMAQLSHIAPLSSAIDASQMELKGQILLFAAIRSSSTTIGYVELGYDQSLLYPIIWQKALQFFAISAFVLIFAALLLTPVVRVPLKPLYRLIEAALKIRAGAFQERLPVMGPSETVRLAEVMNDALDQLAQSVENERLASKRMKQFVAAASHELRTPLTAIRGFTEVLLRRFDTYKTEMEFLYAEARDSDFLPSATIHLTLPDTSRLDDMQKALLTMQRETGRLESLVKDLLQLARLDEGISPQLKDIDLSHVIVNMQAQLDMLATDRQLSYDLVPTRVYADATMIGQIVYNLVMNAIQHTQPQIGKIVVTVSTNSEGSPFLSVQDNGAGIDKESLERIFDRFYRASEARERNPGGAGLGLSIVQAIVQAHGGMIYAQSELGQGTTMVVLFQGERERQ